MHGTCFTQKGTLNRKDSAVREFLFWVETSFWNPATGQPILAGDFPGFFKDEDELRKLWSLPGTRKKLLEELNEKGYSGAQLDDLRKLVHGEDSDLYDVLNYIAYHKELVPRVKRAEKAKNPLSGLQPQTTGVFEFCTGTICKSMN